MESKKLKRIFNLKQSVKKQISRLFAPFIDYRLSNLTRMVEKIDRRVKEIDSELHPRIKITDSELKKDNLSYKNFESIFRGSEKTIKKRQFFYLRFLKNKKRVLDVGCGRGELLELLQKNNISAVGVDKDKDMVNICIKKSLNVINADAIEYLNSLNSSRFDCIFASQFIEHLEYEKFLDFITLCFGKLRPKGTVIFETVNPHCLPALKFFYLDPTHKSVLFPELVKFCLLSLGFINVDNYYMHPIFPKMVNITSNQNKAFFYADYVIIGHK